MTLFLPLDVEYASDDEFVEAGPMAELLFIRAACFIKRKKLDGIIKKSQLALFATGIPQPKRAVQRLIEVGLWEDRGENWFVPSYLKHNPSKKEIETKRELAKESGEYGAHERWHVQEKRPNAKCRFCIAERMGTPMDPPNGVGWPQTEPEPPTEPEPEPEPKTSPGTRSSSTHLAASNDARTTTKDRRFETVVDLIAERQIQEHGTAPRVDADRYRSTIVNRLIANHRDTVIDYLSANPDHPAQLAADRLYLTVEGR